MTDDEFRKQVLGDFQTSERTDLPWQLAKEYYARCDAYDATVCTGKSQDGPVPIDNEEFRLINVNASKVLRELQQKAEAAGFTKQALREAMQEYIRSIER